MHPDRTCMPQSLLAPCIAYVLLAGMRLSSWARRKLMTITYTPTKLRPPAILSDIVPDLLRFHVAWVRIEARADTAFCHG